MEQNNYLDDLATIKTMMSRSSRFISLSGLSGILAGVYALVGAWFAREELRNLVLTNYTTTTETIQILWIIAITVALLSIVTAYVLTSRRAKANKEKIWDISTKKLLAAFLTPLVSGGVFGLIVLYQGYYGLIAAITLIFYGLALINASKYTLGSVKYLGVSEVIVGLFAAFYIGYGLRFWAIGFGVLHIVYGLLMYLKHERK